MDMILPHAAEWEETHMKKLMVLDGNSIVNRAFYGVSQNLTTRTGQPTNAILGFLNILNKLLEEERPDALCVTFDRKAPTFRHLAYEGYKAQRKGMPDELAAQLTRLLAERHLGVIRLEERQKSLEDIFLELTGKAASL